MTALTIADIDHQLLRYAARLRQWANDEHRRMLLLEEVDKWLDLRLEA